MRNYTCCSCGKLNNALGIVPVRLSLSISLDPRKTHKVFRDINVENHPGAGMVSYLQFRQVSSVTLPLEQEIPSQEVQGSVDPIQVKDHKSCELGLSGRDASIWIP
ncbi:hypothetical protein EJB05_18552, partial [Eragrostis curvula]